MIRLSFNKKKITFLVFSFEFLVLSCTNTKFSVKILLTDTFFTVHIYYH